jgi:uracil-DNA glycosylase
MAQQSLVDETAAALTEPSGRIRPAPVVIASVHPSSILRADDRDAELKKLVSDLRTVAAHL